MLYVKHIDMMKKCEAMAKAAGRHPISIWSAANKDKPLNEEQLAARAYILQHEEVPPQYDLFIFNASCETSINIRGRMDFFIAHTTVPTNITQSRGRYRNDLDTLYLLDKECGMVHVPPAYLNRKLYTQDKGELQADLSIKNGKGDPYPWRHVLPLIESNGYTIHTGRDPKTFMVIVGGPSFGSANRTTEFGTCGAS